MQNSITVCLLLTTLCTIQAMYQPSIRPRYSGPGAGTPPRYNTMGAGMSPPYNNMGAGMSPRYNNMGGGMPFTYSNMGGMFGMRRPRNSFRSTPAYLAAKTLGCVYGIDSESMVRFILPRGCTPSQDFCPFKYPGKQCRKVGVVGMCCPFYVSSQVISASTEMAQMRRVMEMLS